MTDRNDGNRWAVVPQILDAGRVENCNRTVAISDQPWSLHRGKKTQPWSFYRGKNRVAWAEFRRRRRTFIEVAGAVSVSTPVWPSRSRWLDAADSWAQGGALTGRMRPGVFMALCAAAARYADSATGRNVAVAAKTLAAEIGCSERTVSTWRAVLLESGLGVLARQGSGGGGRNNRAPIWHLTVPEGMSFYGRKKTTCDLPPLRSSRGLCPVEENSPRRAAARPRGDHAPKRPRQNRPAAGPRPLALQRLAGQLVARAHGLGAISESGWQPPGIAHIGAICDALAAAGIDPALITAADIGRALDADARSTSAGAGVPARRGWIWPDRITNPAGFLACRLKRIGPALQALADERVSAAAPPTPGLDRNTRAGRAASAPVLDVAAARALAAQHTSAMLVACRHCGSAAAVRCRNPRTGAPARLPHLYRLADAAQLSDRPRTVHISPLPCHTVGQRGGVE